MILGPLVNNMPSLEKPKLGGDDNTDVVRGLVREFLDMLGDGEAETHAALSSHVYITALLFVIGSWKQQQVQMQRLQSLLCWVPKFLSSVYIPYPFSIC